MILNLLLLLVFFLYYNYVFRVVSRGLIFFCPKEEESNLDMLHSLEEESKFFNKNAGR
jgi:hypothetical protein